jgi:hypothetical protein
MGDGSRSRPRRSELQRQAEGRRTEVLNNVSRRFYSSFQLGSWHGHCGSSPRRHHGPEILDMWERTAQRAMRDPFPAGVRSRGLALARGRKLSLVNWHRQCLALVSNRGSGLHFPTSPQYERMRPKGPGLAESRKRWDYVEVRCTSLAWKALVRSRAVGKWPKAEPSHSTYSHSAAGCS